MLLAGSLVLSIAFIGFSNAYFSDLISRNDGNYDMVKNIVFVHSTGVGNLSSVISVIGKKEVFSDQNIPEFKPIPPQEPYGSLHNPIQLRPSIQGDNQYREVESQIEKRYAEENNTTKDSAIQNILQERKPAMLYHTSQGYSPDGMEVSKNSVEQKSILNEAPQQKQLWYDNTMMHSTKNKMPFTSNIYKTNPELFVEPKMNESSQSDYFFKFYVHYGTPENVNIKSKPLEQLNDLQLKENVDNESIRNRLNLNEFENAIHKQQQGIIDIQSNKMANTPWYGFKTTPPSCIQCSHLNWLHHYYSMPQIWGDLNGFVSQNSAKKQNEFVDQYKPNRLLHIGDGQKTHSDGHNFNEFFKQAEGIRDYTSIELTTPAPDVSVTPEMHAQESRVQEGYDSRSPRFLPYPYTSSGQTAQRITTKFGLEDARELINGYLSSAIEHTTDSYPFSQTKPDPKEGNQENTYRIPTDPNDGNAENTYRISSNYSSITEGIPSSPSSFNFHQNRQPFLYNDNSGQWRPVVTRVTENQVITTPSFSQLNYEYDTTTPNYQSTKPILEYPSGQNSSDMRIKIEFNPYDSKLQLQHAGSENILETRDIKPYTEPLEDESKSEHKHSFEKRNDMEYEDDAIAEDQGDNDSYEDDDPNEDADDDFAYTQESRHLPREDGRAIPSFQSIDHPAIFDKGILPKLHRYFRLYPITGRYKEYFPEIIYS